MTEPPAPGVDYVGSSFLDADWYVNVPLERSYESAFRGVPEVWRQALEA